MPTHALKSLLPLPFLILAVVAQQAVVLPNGMATNAGSTGNAFPWGWNASGFGGLRHLSIYDSSNLTAQGVTYPILITRLRWRPDDGVTSWGGGVFAQATVALSTAAVDQGAATTNFAANHGPDYTVCYSGPVAHPAGTGSSPGQPAPWSVDVALATPFAYDPALGDLAIDVDYPGGGNYSGGGLPSMDVDGRSTALATRVWGSTMYPNANGVWNDHGVVVEVTFLPSGPGVALASPYGGGCYDRYASFYEQFAPGTFDLANTTLQLVSTGTGYVALPQAGSAFHTPTTTPLSLGNDTVSGPLALGFPLAYPGGTTSAVYVSSNGFVWAQPNQDSGCCSGSGPMLVLGGARWCPLWTDLNPGISGSVFFDVDAVNNAAYVTFQGVQETQTASACTFQVAFFATGEVQYRYQQCAITGTYSVTGWSPGGGARDPGSIDLTSALPVLTEPDQYPLRLATATRPVVNTSLQLQIAAVPPASLLGAVFGGVTQLLPGIDLGAYGMPGCLQLSSQEAVRVFVPAGGSGAVPFGVPNDPGLSGVSVYLQAAALAAGVNAFGALSSNGLELRIGTM